MSYIPTPLLTEILKRLPAKSLQRFKYVSDTWNSTINDPYFINLHLKHSNQNLTHQTLILRSSDLYPIDLSTLEQTLQIDQPLAIDHPLKIPSCETDLVGSCNGLLCLSNGDYDADEQGIIIYNPVTKMHKELPVKPIARFHDDGFPIYICRKVYGFGYDQVDDDYKVVRIIQFDALHPSFCEHEVQVYSLKSQTWSRVWDFPEEYYFTFKRACGVYLNGCLHWVVTRIPDEGGPNLVVGLELGSGRCNVIPQPTYSRGDDDHYSYVFCLNVGVLHGCLYVMCNYVFRTDAWVMKEYGVKESWTKEFSVAQNPCFEYVKPLAYSRDGSKVLLEYNRKALAWFYLQSQSSEHVNVPGMRDTVKGEMMVESLVPLDNEKKESEKKPIKKRDDLDGIMKDSSSSFEHTD